MKKRLLQALARLGSVKYQEAYVVGGTPEEYVLPEDLLEDVASLCALATQDQYRSQFTHHELSHINEMTEAVRRYGSRIFGRATTPDADTLVRGNEDWIALRKTASQCLDSFGVEVEDLSPAEIDREYRAQ